jgi:uncharacterized damage-inducible protein DinB
MELKRFFLEALDNEARASRAVLERVPEGRPEWQPHPKSMRLGYLSALVATMPSWIALMIEQDFLDMKAGGAGPKELATRAELVAALDASVAKARVALEGTTEEHLMTNWQFRVGGQVVTDLPRYVNIRDAVFHHMAHHRGQLTVFLRLNDAPVPAIYGPSADEGKFG